MKTYSVRLKDHGGNIYQIKELRAPSDLEAVSTARELDIPAIGNGFELWDGDRLAHIHPQPKR